MLVSTIIFRKQKGSANECWGNTAQGFLVFPQLTIWRIGLSERGVCTSKMKCLHIYWYESSSLFSGRKLTPEIILNLLIQPVSLYRLLPLLCT